MGYLFEIFPAVVTNLLEPPFVRFQFDVKGRDSSARLGNAASLAFEPIKNPVTGDPESVRVEHETGFIFKSAEVVSAKECQASVGELNFSWPDKAGFVSQTKYGN